MVMSASGQKVTPVVLCILDGWGYREEQATDNTLAVAHLPTWKRLWHEYPHTLVRTDGQAVGLPNGQMGNSEVGHMNIGAGRIALPEFGRIDALLGNGEMRDNPTLQHFITCLKDTGGACHLMGLLSEGGVHSHQDQMVGFARLIADEGITVYIHAFTDGRDTPPKSALNFFKLFEDKIADQPLIQFATVSGRYWGMDRDKRWERVERAYKAIASADSDYPHLPNWSEAIESAYAREETDEFIAPTVISGYNGMKAGDALIMTNFRSDRARQILTAFVDPAFDGFEREQVHFSAVCGAVKYSDKLAPFVPALVTPLPYPETLGEVVSKEGLNQLRLAETEKFAHVTFFLNGGVESIFEGEDRILVPSPKVATYDLQPEMSAVEVTNHLVTAIESQKYGLIVVNFANPDMVGHTGKIEAAKKAVETIDTCLERIEQSVKKTGTTLLITADHGNVEEMRDLLTNQPHTQHTTYPVPLVLIQGGETSFTLTQGTGKLADLAPTVLQLMGLKQPQVMTGCSLVTLV